MTSFFCIIYVHLFALIVKHFLLCNYLLFIVRVCQHLGGCNHGDSSLSKHCSLPLLSALVFYIMGIGAKPCSDPWHATLTSRSRCLFISNQSYTLTPHMHTLTLMYACMLVDLTHMSAIYCPCKLMCALSSRRGALHAHCVTSRLV